MKEQQPPPFNRIMVLEDNEELAILIKKNLTRHGFVISVCSDEKNAISQLLENSHDILLMDYQLKEMTGKDIIYQLEQKGHSIPFIIMTGHGDEKIAVEMMKMGAMDYVVKDVNFIELLPTILQKAVGALQTQWNLKQVEKSLKKSEEQYRTLFENSLDAITFMGGNPSRMMMVNPAFSKMTGYSPEEVLSFSLEDLWEIVHIEDRPVVKQFFCDQITRNKFEFRIVRKDGTIRWVEVMNSISTNRGERAIQSIYRDITERKNAEDELKKSEERFKLAIEAATHGIFDWNFKTNEMYFSPFYFKMLGYQFNEFPPSVDTWKALFHPDDLPAALELVSQYHANKITSHQIEFRMKSKSGEWKWILSRGKIVERDIHGNSVRLIGTHVDITSHKQAEAERSKLENQLRQAQKMEAVGQLAGGIAHDFNNLLFVITGYSEMMLEEIPKDSKLYNWMNHIMKTTERATTLVRQLLLFSRKEAMQLKTIQLNELIQNMMKMIQRIIGEHIFLEFSPDNTLHQVIADPGQIEQVIMNLCVNARDAMPDGGSILIETQNVTIDDEYCKHHTWAKPGDYVMCSVSDTGVGIPKEIIDHIFEPFFTTKEVGKGTGLGLSAAYGIVKSHNGMIHVYSHPGSGSTFKIYLPAYKEISSTPPVKETKLKIPNVTGSGATILVAEDEESVRNMISQILELNGYRVISAKDGEEAIRIFEQLADQITLVLLDVVMPKMSGTKVLQKIKLVKPDIPVILMSGYSKGVLNYMFSSTHQYEMLQKPYSYVELLLKIQQLMSS